MRYAELISKTHYSFLEGASHPAELVEQAAALGLSALGVADRNGVYGIPKAYFEAKKHSGLKLLVGAEVQITGACPLVVLVQDRAAYGFLCRLLTAAHHEKPKGEASLSWLEFLSFLQTEPCSWPDAQKGWWIFPRWQEVESGLPVAHASPSANPYQFLGELKELFPEQVALPLSRFLDGRDRRRTESALRLQERYGLPVFATNDVHYHHPDRRMLQDVMSAIRSGKSLEEMGTGLFSNAERYLKSPAQMLKLFQDMPRAIQLTHEIAEQCQFSPGELKYRYPSEWIPQGETAQSYLERLVSEGAKKRYPTGVPTQVERQIRHEMKLISELGYADYFLTIWEIVDWARNRRILCQGRGSAANSVVCYCLEITAVDPVRMNLLFERFISAERNEPPDIDVDFENARREEVIQHIYEKYGRDRAGMVAAVITYRDRLANREVLRVLGREESAISEQLQGVPRHLSIHSGGFTLSADPLVETVPIENARMEGRTIVQWDKNDLEAIGLIKVDILALGMLTALRKALDEVGMELSEVPAEDPATYEMIQRADTIGVFQIESRAQMSMLPRLKPQTFYDLVVQVAIVRPGPIVGQMVHPYLRRRRGQERVDYPHPKLEPILKKTLGVPLFQEQVMKIAIELAGFTPGEADELRRAIAAWRSSGSIERVGAKLRKGLLEQKLPVEFVDRIFQQIQGFAEYGFPESHAASFALLAYASAYLKNHHPAEFTWALLNSQPMGFYQSHTLVDDVKRYGVEVRSVHPHSSDWDCTLEHGPGGKAIRLGWRTVHGLGESAAQELLQEKKTRAFSSLEDFLARTRLSNEVLHRLALSNAFGCFGEEPREALWKILSNDRIYRSSSRLLQASTPVQLSLFSQASLQTETETALKRQQKQKLQPDTSLFPRMNHSESIQADYEAYGLSVRGHPMALMRERMQQASLAQMTSGKARMQANGKRLRVAGLVIVRQRPPTAKGTAFVTLEDEEGVLDLILHREVYEASREVLLGHAFVLVEGKLQKEGHAVSVIVQKMSSLESALFQAEAIRVNRGKYFT